MQKLADAAGTSPQQIERLERLDEKGRELTKSWAIRLAQHLDVSPIDLLFGQQDPVPVVGSIDSDGLVSFVGGREAYGVIPVPPGRAEETVALEVMGSLMRNLVEDGYFIIYDDQRSTIDNEFIGELCVVGLVDGRVMVRTPQHGRSEGHYDLESATRPTLRDQQLEWASLVTTIIPRAAARKLPLPRA